MGSIESINYDRTASKKIEQKENKDLIEKYSQTIKSKQIFELDGIIPCEPPTEFLQKYQFDYKKSLERAGGTAMSKTIENKLDGYLERCNMNIGEIVTMDIGLFITFCGKFVEDIITYENDFTSAVANCDLSEQMEMGLGDCDKYSSINYHVFNYLKKFNSKIRNVYITENSITDGCISGTMSAMPHARNNYLIFTEEELVVSTLDVTFSDDDDISMNYGEHGKHLEENPTINSLKIKLNLGYYVDVVKEIENLDFYDNPLRQQLKIITILGNALNHLDASHEDVLGKSITKIKILDMSRKMVVYVESLNTDDINNNIIDNYYIREYAGKILLSYKVIFWRNTLPEDENTVERLIEKIDKGQERSAYK